MVKTMKAGAIVLMVLVCAASANAATYSFQGADVDVDAWVGTGANETILVVDWNRLDHGLATVSESHAFGYRWDGTKTVLAMLQDFDAAGTFDLTTKTYAFGTVVQDIAFSDSDEPTGLHSHIEPGGWNAASTSDPNADWGDWSGWPPVTDWDSNAGGIDIEPLADGQFEGLNAVLYYSATPQEADTALDIPLASTAPDVPEPATMLLFGVSLAGLVPALRRRR